MPKNLIAKVLAFSIIVLFIGTCIGPIARGVVEPQSVLMNSSHAQAKQSNGFGVKEVPKGPPNGLAPPIKQTQPQTTAQKKQRTPQGNRGYFYAYNAYDPNGMNNGEVAFDNGAVVNLIGSGSGINFITGEDIDESGDCYGVSYYGGLYSIDVYTGAMTLVANTIPLDSLVYNGAGIWYACGYDESYQDSLFTIDIDTGETTLVGHFNQNTIMISIMMDSPENMYGYDVLFGGNSHLYSIDKSTGYATPIGDMGHDFCYAQEGKFDKVDGTLYLAAYDIGTWQSYLAICDPETAEVTIINEFSPWGIEIDGLALPFGWLTPGVGVNKIIAPVSGEASIITPEIIIQNNGWYDVNDLPVNMTIVKHQYAGYLDEHFNETTFPPSGWSNLATTDHWVQSSTCYAGGTSPEAVLWNYNNYNGTGGLQSPYLDTSSAASLRLSFRSTISWSGGPCTCKVEVTGDGGITWHDVTPWVNPISVSQGNHYTVDISAYNGIQTGVRFIYSGQYSWLNFWALDDVIMFDQILEYNQTVYTDVPAWMTMNITFPDWVPSDYGCSHNESIEYVVNATTQYDDNQRPDFYKQKTFVLHFNFSYSDDVAITDINSPTSGIAQTQPVQVVLADKGQNDENVDVNVKIGKVIYDILLQEDFSSGVPPTGWGTDLPSNWLSSPTNYAGGTAPEAELSWTPSQTGDFHLYTYAIDTTGWTSALLKFKEYVNDYNGQYTLKIQSKWGGGDWHDVYTRAGGPYGPTETQVTFGTADGLGASDLMISFTFSGNLYNINYWYIDDVWFGQMTMATEYNQTVNVNINSGQTMNVDLPDWTPADIPQCATEIDYLVDASASMNISDGYPLDNELTNLITLRYEHDVGVTEITEPAFYPIKDRDLTWFTYGDGNANSIGLTSGGTFEGAIRLTPAELAPFDGMQLATVKYCHGMLSGSGEPATDGFMKIYGPGTATQPGALLVSAPFHTPQGNDWYQYNFSWPVIVNATQDLWFSVEVDNTPAGANPLGCDAGPAVDGKANWASLDGGATWIELQTYGLDYNWNHMIGFEAYTPPPPPGTYQVEANVKNFGSVFPESNIPVEARITHVDNQTVIYDHTVTIPGPLAPNQTTSVQFPDVTIANLSAWEGRYKLEIWTALPGDDHPENDKKTAYYGIIIPDFLPPITNHTINGTMGLQGWYVSNVLITLSAYDPSPPLKDGPKPPSGVRFTYFKLHNADPWTMYNGSSVIVSNDGNYELSYYSDDWAGNVETPKGPFPFKVDNTAPVIDLTCTSLNCHKTKWLLNATVADATSGVAKVEFYIDDVFIGNVTAYPYTLIYEGKGKDADAIVYDNAGNSAMSVQVSYNDLMLTMQLNFQDQFMVVQHQPPEQ